MLHIAAQALHYAVPVAAVGLAVGILRLWLAHRTEAHGALAFAIGALALSPVAGRLGVLHDGTVELGAIAALAALLASGYGLLWFRHTLLRLTRRAHVAATIAIAGAGVAGIPLVLVGARAGGPKPLAAAGFAMIATAWGACTLEPVVRFWRASAGRPRVQRARLRAIAAGYLLLAGVIVLTAANLPPEGHSAAGMLRNGLALLAAPLLYVAFVPPRWLQGVWRQPEEAALGRATAKLLGAATHEGEIAEQGLDEAIRLVGGAGGVLCAPEENVVATRGIDAATAERVTAEHRAVEHPAIVQQAAGPHSHAVAVPIHARAGRGLLVILADPFTPFFGTDEVGRLEHYAVLLTSAFDRVRLDAELRRERDHSTMLLDALGDLGEGVVLTEDDRFSYVNEAFCRMTGYTPDELYALPSGLALLAPDEHDEMLDKRRTYQQGESWQSRFETVLARRDGARIDIEVAVKELVSSDEQRRFVGVVRDVTDRKAAAAEADRAYRQEREAVRRLKTLDAMKDAFLTAVSHELRTPLTTVLGVARTLHGEQGDRLTLAQRRDFLERLLTGAEKLEHLVEDLLDVDRLKRGVSSPRQSALEVGALVRRVVESSGVPSTRPVAVHAEPAVAPVDPAMVERIVENLLVNAAKHTPAGSPIEISVRPQDGGVLICVEDTGDGVPDEQKESVFEAFVRGPDVPRHAPGVGIGLSLVRRFAELHGGSAWVTDRAGGGASVQVFLPGTDVLEISPGEQRAARS